MYQGEIESPMRCERFASDTLRSIPITIEGCSRALFHLAYYSRRLRGVTDVFIEVNAATQLFIAHSQLRHLGNAGSSAGRTPAVLCAWRSLM